MGKRSEIEKPDREITLNRKKRREPKRHGAVRNNMAESISRTPCSHHIYNIFAERNFVVFNTRAVESLEKRDSDSDFNSEFSNNTTPTPIPTKKV